MLRNLQKQGTVVIANGAAISGALEIPVGYALAGIVSPSAWTAADIGFSFSTDGGTTFVSLSGPTGTTTSFQRITGIATAAAQWNVVPIILHELALGIQVKLTSINVASNADVNQGAARSLDIWVGRAN